jgi:hypothetical protein
MMTPYITLYDIISHAIDELMDGDRRGGFAKLMSISKIPSKYLKCPTCFRTLDVPRVQSIINDAMAYRDNRPFNVEDPVIVSETEVYCNAKCYAVALVKKEEGLT